MTGVWCSITNCDRDHVRRLMPCRLCRWRACLSRRRRLSTRTLASKACREREDYARSLLYYPQAFSTYTTPSGHAIIRDSARMYSIGPRLVSLCSDLHGWDNPYGHTAETSCTRPAHGSRAGRGSRGCIASDWRCGSPPGGSLWTDARCRATKSHTWRHSVRCAEAARASLSRTRPSNSIHWRID